jgi:hypothetical protein
MSPDRVETEPAVFEVRDCNLISMATGHRVLTLQELRNRLADIGAGSIFCHFWGGLLQARFEEREFNNDFAAWARHELHDHVLAERLAILDPFELSDPEELRSALLDLLDDRIDEEPYLARRLATREFHFLDAQIVTFATGSLLQSPAELAGAVPDMSVGSIFFHFIEARRRHAEGLDDFAAWLEGFDGRYAELIKRLRNIDPYFASLVELRREIGETVAACLEAEIR